MSVHEEIVSALSALKIPVRFQVYSGKELPYLTYFMVWERGTLHADDQEKSEGCLVQLDLWSKGDYRELVRTVQEVMESAGFCRQLFYDLYESSTAIHHKVMRFYREVP